MFLNISNDTIAISSFFTFTAAILAAILDLHASYATEVHPIILLGCQNLDLDPKSMSPSGLITKL